MSNDVMRIVVLIFKYITDTSAELKIDNKVNVLDSSSTVSTEIYLTSHPSLMWPKPLNEELFQFVQFFWMSNFFYSEFNELLFITQKTTIFHSSF